VWKNFPHHVRDITSRAEPAIPAPPTPSDALLAACRRILRPLVRVLIARGIMLPALVTLLKRVYVEVAADSFALDGRPPTDSRVSLLTGVHRKDVRALRESGAPAGSPPSPGIGASVVGRWLGDARYVPPSGQPRRLPRSAPAGEPSFNALVAEVSADVRPRTVLDELERQGLVAVDADADTVTLLAEAFVPCQGDSAMLQLFAANLHDHAAAAAANLLAEDGRPVFLERAVYYNHLSATSVAELEREARERGIAALVELNALALARQDADATSPDADQRFRFGVYFYRAPQSNRPADNPPRAGDGPPGTKP
jgi:hypothetical protein